MCCEKGISVVYQVIQCGHSSLHSVHPEVHLVLHRLHLVFPSRLAYVESSRWCIFSSGLPTGHIALCLALFATFISGLVIVATLLMIVGFELLLSQLFNLYFQHLVLQH